MTTRLGNLNKSLLSSFNCNTNEFGSEHSSVLLFRIRWQLYISCKSVGFFINLHKLLLLEGFKLGGKGSNIVICYGLTRPLSVECVGELIYFHPGQFLQTFSHLPYTPLCY